MRMRDTFILSLAVIVLAVAFIGTTQQIKQNQNNIISRIESLEQAEEDPGEDPGETPAIKNYIKVVELQPGETLELTEDMYFIEVSFMRNFAGGIYSETDDDIRIDVLSQENYDGDSLNSYKFRYYIGNTYYMYQFDAKWLYSSENPDGYRIESGAVYIAGSLPFIKLSEDNESSATVIIYYK